MTAKTLQITPSTRHAIYLEIWLNGEMRPDCIGVDLDTSEALFYVVPSPADTSLSAREILRIKGRIQLRFIMPPIGIGVDQAIKEIEQSVLWHALSDDERRARVQGQFQDPSPLPREAEAQTAIRAMFADYLTEVASANRPA